ncbi:MAG: hypothetical protein AMXMBFR13_50330 [Phycisphaerae bacterium]
MKDSNHDYFRRLHEIEGPVGEASQQRPSDLLVNDWECLGPLPKGLKGNFDSLQESIPKT